jgi:iron complex transport system ATP-binding protein
VTAAALAAEGLVVPGAPGDKPRLDRVGVRVQPGEMVGVIGPNGAGKSSLLACLGGVLKPAAGQVLLDDVPLGRLSRSAIARSVAFVDPGTDGVSLTAFEVVGLGRIAHRARLGAGLSAEDQRCVRLALEEVDAANLASRPLSTLSQGERQRVLLAVALAQEARYLLLDEPTAHLDPGHARQILDRVAALARNGRRSQPVGVLAVMHDLTLAAQYCDRLLILAHGRVVGAGTPEEVYDPSLLSTLYGTPVRVLRHPETGRPVVVPSFGATAVPGRPAAPAGA